jgi:hypothetical protein
MLIFSDMLVSDAGASLYQQEKSSLSNAFITGFMPGVFNPLQIRNQHNEGWYQTEQQI